MTFWHVTHFSCENFHNSAISKWTKAKCLRGKIFAEYEQDTKVLQGISVTTFDSLNTISILLNCFQTIRASEMDRYLNDALSAADNLCFCPSSG